MQKGQRLSAQARRKYIVETVVKLCAEEEPATLTTGRIASRMGVTQGALFRHFASKEEIWEAVTSWVTERIIREIDEAAACGGEQWPVDDGETGSAQFEHAGGSFGGLVGADDGRYLTRVENAYQ